MGIFKPPFSVWKDEIRVPMELPESSKYPQGLVRQRNKPVLIAFGIADMDAPFVSIDISNSQPDAFSKTQSHAVDGEEKDPVTQPVCSSYELVYLLHSQDIRNPGGFRWFYERNILPCLMEDIGVKESQAIEIKLYGTPRTGVQEIIEIVEKLIQCKIVNGAVEIVSNASECPGICFNCFWSQPVESEIFLVLLIILDEPGIIWHAGIHGNLLFAVVE